MGPLEKTLNLAERILGISDFQRCIEICYAVTGREVYGILVSDIRRRTLLIPEGRVVKIFSCVQSTQCAGALREDIMPINGGSLVARVAVSLG